MKIDRPIVFFDGHCNMCSWKVAFILKYKNKDRLFFVSPLQGEHAEKVLPSALVSDLNTIVVYYPNGDHAVKSRAIFHICSWLKFPFSLLGMFMILPKKFTDTLYDFVAKNRYKFFKRSELCRLPSEEERSYFLP